MSDTTDTSPTESPANDDPLQVINLIEEAMQLVLQSSPTIVEEAHNLEALCESYQSDVESYTNTFATAWDASMKAYQAEVDKWQAATAAFKAQTQVGDVNLVQNQVANALLNSINAAAEEAAAEETAAPSAKTKSTSSSTVKKSQN